MQALHHQPPPQPSPASGGGSMVCFSMPAPQPSHASGGGSMVCFSMPAPQPSHASGRGSRFFLSRGFPPCPEIHLPRLGIRPPSLARREEEGGESRGKAAPYLARSAEIMCRIMERGRICSLPCAQRRDNVPNHAKRKNLLPPLRAARGRVGEGAWRGHESCVIL